MERNKMENGEMLPYEKEDVLARELSRTIDRLSQEYNITYAQVIGCLEFVKKQVMEEANEEPQDEI